MHNTIRSHSCSDYTFGYMNCLSAECPGCSVLQSCSGINTCTSSCGHILSPAYLGDYDNDIRCTWAIYVSKDSYIHLTFSYFHIRELSSSECLYDKLSVYNEKPQDDGRLTKQDLIGSYCNTYNPPSLIESKWNALVLEFVTDSVGTAGGFWATYTDIEYTASSLAHGSNNTLGNTQITARIPSTYIVSSCSITYSMYTIQYTTSNIYYCCKRPMSQIWIV